MPHTHFPRLVLAATLVLVFAGCSSAPAPQTSPPPPPQAGTTRIVSGAGDSVGSIPGDPSAPFRYRFRQIAPASDRFTFQDRELSFYFKPTPDALHFQVENRQDRPVWIDWDRSTFYDPNGNSSKVAHGTTRWPDRFQVQPSTQIPGLQRYGDYLLPIDYLVDPAGSQQQLHVPLLPQDSTSPQYSDREFGVDLVFLVEDRPRTYTFRFKVASVIPR
ncbi:MAG TPA: hypothetical protein VEY91_04825 [Candidatus Limnocylindria bacterium]|nr:hypothetical protein [Candidatus Limnocylindria bacterium]